MDASLAGLTLHVADIERSLEFYRKIPGGSVMFHMPGQFAMVRIGDGRLGLLRDCQRAFHIELETTDLDGMYAQLAEIGITAEGPPAQRPWGERDFIVMDPDGNMLEFGVAR